MNAPAVFPSISLELNPFTAAGAAVDAWRGRCISLFARAEAAATDFLVRLPLQDAGSTPRQFYVQRLMALESALAANQEWAKAASALRQFRTQDQLRTFLTHGHAKVTLDRKEQWQVVLMITDLRSTPVRTVLVIDRDESDAICKRLHSDCQRLKSILENIDLPAPACVSLLRTGAG